MFSIEQIMVFAAGRGVRLKPLTDIVPKALIPLAPGICALSLLFDNIKLLGASCIVINTHHLAPIMHAFLDQYQWMKGVHISDENELLETGGGLLKALPFFDLKKPVLTVNSDIYWENQEGFSLFDTFYKKWPNCGNGILLGLVHRSNALSPIEQGDYIYEGSGKIQRKCSVDTEYVYSGIALISSKLLSSLATRSVHPFSLVELFDECQSKGLLFGCPLPIQWIDIGTFASLKKIRSLF